MTEIATHNLNEFPSMLAIAPSSAGVIEFPFI